MTPERTDLYQVLGLAPDADERQLDQAFRVLARRHHPDTQTPDKTGRTEPDSEPDGEPGNEADSERFQEILAAYSVLRDPVARAAYDRRTNKPIADGPATSARRPPDHIRQQFGPGSPVTPLAPTMCTEPPLRVGPVRWTASTGQTTPATDKPGDPATDRRRAAAPAPEPPPRQAP